MRMGSDRTMGTLHARTDIFNSLVTTASRMARLIECFHRLPAKWPVRDHFQY